MEKFIFEKIKLANELIKEARKLRGHQQLNAADAKLDAASRIIANVTAVAERKMT